MYILEIEGFGPNSRGINVDILGNSPKSCIYVSVSHMYCAVHSQDEISALRRRLEKSEKERNELRQNIDSVETKVCGTLLTAPY